VEQKSKQEALKSKLSKEEFVLKLGSQKEDFFKKYKAKNVTGKIDVSEVNSKPGTWILSDPFGNKTSGSWEWLKPFIEEIPLTAVYYFKESGSRNCVWYPEGFYYLEGSNLISHYKVLPPYPYAKITLKTSDGTEIYWLNNSGSFWKKR
jgi:hypothetical protein